MVLNTKLDDMITESYRTKHEKERAEHKSSGKINPSGLGYPIQWQVLKVIGVPGREIDDYALRMFDRGNDVEDKAIEWLNEHTEVKGTQVEINYPGVFGYIDAMVDGKIWGLGEIPVEVKSVKNAKFKRIATSGGPDRGHLLQATIYGIATKKDNFAILYVSADDYRTMCFVGNTDDHKGEVLTTVGKVQACLDNGFVPTFEAVETWNTNPQYNHYMEWVNLDRGQIEAKLKEDYPDAYKKLKQGVKNGKSNN